MQPIFALTFLKEVEVLLVRLVYSSIFFGLLSFPGKKRDLLFSIETMYLKKSHEWISRNVGLITKAITNSLNSTWKNNDSSKDYSK